MTIFFQEYSDEELEPYKEVIDTNNIVEMYALNYKLTQFYVELRRQNLID